jgi:WD40 repeat protein
VTRGTKLLADVDAAWLVSPKGEVELWSPTEGSQHMPGGAFEPTSLARCPDGSVVLGSYGPEVRRWRPGDATVTVWEAHADDVADVACAEDRVVTGSWGGGVAVWTPEGKLRTRYAPLGADVRRVAVSDDGRHVAAATRDRRVRVWTGSALAIAADLPDHPEAIWLDGDALLAEVDGRVLGLAIDADAASRTASWTNVRLCADGPAVPVTPWPDDGIWAPEPACR